MDSKVLTEDIIPNLKAKIPESPFAVFPIDYIEISGDSVSTQDGFGGSHTVSFSFSDVLAAIQAGKGIILSGAGGSIVMSNVWIDRVGINMSFVAENQQASSAPVQSRAPSMPTIPVYCLATMTSSDPNTLTITTKAFTFS